MKLFEHPDFEQAILRAAEHFRGRGLRPAIIEKDYYVTEALRIIADAAGDKVIFKGGTSLSKGWNLIGGSPRTSTSSSIRSPSSRRSGSGHRPRTQAAARRGRAASRPDVHARPRARPSAASVAATGSPTCSASAAPARSPTACCSKREPPAAASRRAPSSLRSYLAQFLQETGQSLGRGRRGAVSRCGCCTFDAPSSRRCSPSTARSNCSSATAADRILRPALLRPLPARGPARSARDAAIRRVRRDQGRLRPDQPRAFPQELLPSGRHELRPERRAVSAAGTGGHHRTRVRAAMPNALLRRFPVLDRGAGPVRRTRQLAVTRPLTEAWLSRSFRHSLYLYLCAACSRRVRWPPQAA